MEVVSIGMVLVLLLAATLLTLWCSSRPPCKSTQQLPAGPRPWPLLGNLPFLIAHSSIPHRALARLSLSHGPLFTFFLGSFPYLVVSSPQLAKHFLHTLDKNFSDRPPLGVARFLLYGQHNGLIFAPYGPQWRGLRKLFNLELFSHKRLQDYQHIRYEEVASMIQFVERQSRKGQGFVEVGKVVSRMAANIIARLALSTILVDWTTGECHDLHHALCESNRVALCLLIGDYVPSLGWLDLLTRRRMRRLHHRIDKLLSDIVRDRLRETGRSNQDFLDVMLAKAGGLGEDALDSVKSVLLELFAAGTDTSSVVVEWAMAELICHPNDLKKLQEEIDVIMAGENRLVRESDLGQLPYLKAVIKEVLRLYPPGPLLLPHASQEDCMVVGGSRISAGVRLLVNVWAIGRDPSIWDRADEFVPSRFLNNNMDVHGHDFQLLPFGSGRRMCPGMPLALQIVALTLANLVHAFHWGQVGTHLDMSEKYQGALVMVNPLCAIPISRL